MNKLILLVVSVVACVSFIRCEKEEEYASPQELMALLNRANQAVAEIDNLIATKGNKFYHKESLESWKSIILNTMLDEKSKAETVQEAKVTKKKAQNYSLRFQTAEKIIKDAKDNKVPKRKSNRNKAK